VNVAGGEACPDPGEAVDLPEFIERLRCLRIWAGSPSYRALAKKVGPLLRPPQTLSQSTIGDVFQSRRRRLDPDLVVGIVRALGLEERTVDRWRAACVRVHAEAKSGGAVGVFRQLPADLATFTGRDTDLRELIGAIDSARGAARTVVISALEGMAGVGKTQLVVHAAHELVRAGRYRDMQLFVNLRGFDPDQPPADPSAVLDSFLRALEVPAQQIPTDLDARAAMFRDRLHDKDALIVLDNAASEEQVRRLIPAGPGCLVLITSRRHLAGLEDAFLHQLDVLAAAEAVELLGRIAGVERVQAEPAAAAAIAESCGFLPLAVALAGGRLRSRPAWSLAHLAEHLQARQPPGSDRRLSAIFDLSYRGLAPEARRIFHTVGLSPGADISVPAAAAMAGITAHEAQQGLELLVDEHLAQQEHFGRYQLHDLLRAYAAERAELESPKECAEALHRAAAWYTVAADAAAQAIMPTRYSEPLRPEETAGFNVTFDSSAEAMAWCDAERANLAATVLAAAQSPSPYLAWRLPVAMSTYLHLTCSWPQWEHLHQLGLSAATSSADLAGEAWILSNLGIAQTELGRFDEAADHLTRALQLRRDLGDTSGEAATLGNLARLYAYADQLESGLYYARQALDLARRTGDRRRECAALNSVACCLGELGRTDEALEYFQAKLQMHRQDGDLRGLGLALHNIGSACNQTGRHADAFTTFQEALDVARGFGERHSEAGALYGMALALDGLNDLDQARPYLEQALAIFEDLNAPETQEARSQLARLRSRVAEGGHPGEG